MLSPPPPGRKPLTFPTTAEDSRVYALLSPSSTMTTPKSIRKPMATYLMTSPAALAAMPRAEKRPPISVKVIDMPSTIATGLSLLPTLPASRGGSMGIMQGVATVSTPARNTSAREGSASISQPPSAAEAGKLRSHTNPPAQLRPTPPHPRRRVLNFFSTPASP